MKKYFRFICLALLLPIVMQIAMPMLAADVASNAKTIRVGYMNHPGFIEERDGEFFGYGVEYFNEICKYAGWNIEYKYGLWKDQLEMLENGEIDIGRWLSVPMSVPRSISIPSSRWDLFNACF